MTRRQKLFDKITENIKPGRVEWIGLRTERRGTIEVVDSAVALRDLGLEGDRRCQGSPGSARQVTFISLEHIQVVASLLALNTIDPSLLRRNIVISGVNIHALRYQRFKIGDATFEATAQCHPCSRMEKALGDGGHAAMLGHGGLCAKVIAGGKIALGDPVVKLAIEE